MNDDHPDDDLPDWSPITPGGHGAGSRDLLRGDGLVTLALLGIVARRPTPRGGDPVSSELRKMIAQEPDLPGLVYQLIVEKAARIMIDAKAAGVGPLDYWRRRQIQSLDSAVRIRERFDRGDDPEDILDHEAQLRRERAARETAERDDEQCDDSGDDHGEGADP